MMTLDYYEIDCGHTEQLAVVVCACGGMHTLSFLVQADFRRKFAMFEEKLP